MSWEKREDSTFNIDKIMIGLILFTVIQVIMMGLHLDSKELEKEKNVTTTQIRNERSLGVIEYGKTVKYRQLDSSTNGGS